MIATWPSGLRALPQRGGWTGGPRDDRAAFEPDTGPPILRRRVTGATAEYAATFANLRAAGIAAFERWYLEDLAGGSLPFLYRDPVRGDVARWLIAPGSGRPYSYRANGADLHDLSMTLLRMPGIPAIAPYVLAGGDDSLRAPHGVADYDAGVYLVDGAGVPASEIAALLGTYDVLTVSDQGAETWELDHPVLAGDIPATRPAGVARILAFVP